MGGRWLSGEESPAEMGLPRKGGQRMFLEEEAAYKGGFTLKAAGAALFIFVLKCTFQIHAN